MDIGIAPPRRKSVTESTAREGQSSTLRPSSSASISAEKLYRIRIGRRPRRSKQAENELDHQAEHATPRRRALRRGCNHPLKRGRIRNRLNIEPVNEKLRSAQQRYPHVEWSERLTSDG